MSLHAFLISLTTVAVAEVGDRTQLLALLLAARYRAPWQILWGMVLATLANHGLAAVIGRLLAQWLTPTVVAGAVGFAFIVMAAWMLKPDALEPVAATSGRSALVASSIAFFIAECGDKTQIATMTLAAGYGDISGVVAGSTLGLALVNAPVIFLSGAFARRLPLRSIRIIACVMFAVIGIIFLSRAFS